MIDAHEKIQAHSDRFCSICRGGSGTMVSAHENDKTFRFEHLYHLSCLSLSRYLSSTPDRCPSCMQPTNLSEASQEYICSPEHIFMAACRAGMLKVIEALAEKTSFQKIIIETGFACATFESHMEIIGFLTKKYSSSGCSLNCLQIALRQKDMTMIRYWAKHCVEERFNWLQEILMEDQSVDSYKCMRHYFGASFDDRMCFYWAIKSANYELVCFMIDQMSQRNLYFKLREFVSRNQLESYRMVCNASLWGNAEVLECMERKGFDLQFYNNLPILCAHFMRNSDAERFLTSRGFSVDMKSCHYKLLQSASTGNIALMMQNLFDMKRLKNGTKEELLLKIMLILAIGNGNVFLIVHLFRNLPYEFKGFELHQAFGYALHQPEMSILANFLFRYPDLEYLVAIEGVKRTDYELLDKGLGRTRTWFTRTAGLMAYQYGVIHHNMKLMNQARNKLSV